MSKNITIKQDGTAENFNSVEIVRTTKQGGGSVDWVPEDETQAVKLIVTACGEYEAEDQGVYGWYEVETSGLKDAEATKTVSKSVDKNGTYHAVHDGAYGYSVAYVRVKGGGKYTDPDTGETVVPEPGVDDGCAITGKDEDGDEAIVEVDKGKLKETKLADHILLDTPPDKLIYADGERIVLSGAVVRGYLKNGTPYKNASYQDSILPLYQGGDQESGSEDWLPGGVVFPDPRYADISQAGGGDDVIEVDDPSILNVPEASPAMFVEISSGGSYTFVHKTANNAGYKHIITAGNAPVFVFFYTDEIQLLVIGAVSRSGFVDLRGWGRDAESAVPTITETAGLLTDAYVGDYYYTWDNYTETETSEPVNDIKKSVQSHDMARIAFLGKVSTGGMQTITLKWPREGDRKILTTTFEIEVTEQ